MNTSFDANAAADLFRTPPTGFVDTADGAVAYRSVGSGPDVLFVHGWPVSGATFRTLLPYLADQVRCHIIDLPGAGDSQFDAHTRVSVDRHIDSVRRTVDVLGLDDVALVGHDSGGLIVRHALADDPRVRGWGLVNTEQPQGLTWRFKSFIHAAKLPGAGKALGWVSRSPRLRRHPLLFGEVFSDSLHLNGEFDEFFLQRLRDSPRHQRAAAAFARSFDQRLCQELSALHRRLCAPVQLVWGVDDPFFPIERARDMVHTFPHASLAEIEEASLFVHEERPAEVARALLPVLKGRM